jgi:tetratricopeptide (TPR) repeat protein
MNLTTVLSPARAFVVAAVLLTASVASLLGEAQSERLLKAGALASEGRAAEAEEAYRAILNNLDVSGTDVPRAAQGLARLLAAGSVDRQDEAADLYARAAKLGDARLRIEATNGLGVLRLRQGRAPEAADLLASVESQVHESNDFDAFARSRYLYNYATALEKSGSIEKAFARFLEALDLDPSFQPACEGAERAAKAFPPEGRVKQLGELSHLLIQKGELSAVREYLLRTLRDGRDLSGAPYDDLLVLLVQYWTAARVTPEDAQNDWLPVLSQAASWMSPISRDRVTRIRTAYTTGMPPILDRFQAEASFGAWRTPKEAASAFSGFLKTLGDVFLEKGDARGAVSRYALAFSATGNLDAAVYLAGLLLNQHPSLDPEGRLLNEFIGGVFYAKGESYLRDDWPNILRLHSLLGTIFERQGRWGSSGDAKSAIFQWEHAIAALEKLPGRGQGDAPALHAHLAASYAGGHRRKEALQQYIIAAEQYVAAQRPEAAELLMMRIHTLDSVAGEADRQRAKAVREAIGRVSKVPTGDADITAQILSKLAADPELIRNQIQVETRDGEVKVSGSVKDKSKADEIEKLIGSTAGVKKVVTDIDKPHP